MIVGLTLFHPVPAFTDDYLPCLDAARTIAPTSNIQWDGSLAIDRSDTWHVVYYESSPSYTQTSLLHVDEASGPSAVPVDVAIERIHGSALAVAPDGGLWIAYVMDDTLIRCIVRSAAGVYTQPITLYSGAEPIGHLALSVASNGVWHLAFSTQSLSREIRYTSASTGVTVLIGTLPLTSYEDLGMAVGSDGEIHVVYTHDDATTSGITHVWRSTEGAPWTSEALLQLFDGVVTSVGLALDGGNAIHVVYGTGASPTGPMDINYLGPQAAHQLLMQGFLARIAMSSSGAISVLAGGGWPLNYLLMRSQCRPTAYFYCDKQGSFSLPAPILLSNSRYPQPAKVCADGADAEVVTLHVSGISNISNVYFRIKEDLSAASPNVYGKFTTQKVYAADSIGYRYVHPTTPPPANQIPLPITLQAYDSQSGSPLFEWPLAIYPAPVVMVHGLWDDSRSFSSMIDSFKRSGSYPAELLIAADYSTTADRSYRVNSGVVAEAIDVALWQARNAHYAVGKVDLVGHSMGAVLTRLYLQHSYLDALPYRGDINRFVALNAPNWGSQCANLLMDTNIGLLPLIWEGLLRTGHDPSKGAVDNLRVDSPKTTTVLNGAQVIHNGIVPTHIVFTTGGFGDPGGGGLALAYWLAAVSLHESKETLASQLFGGDVSDLIVSAQSQRGGHTSAGCECRARATAYGLSVESPCDRQRAECPAHAA